LRERQAVAGLHLRQLAALFIVIGALAALILAILEADAFWIANAVYLAFVLSAVLGSITKIALYRGGLPTW
jgi:hypothetical protein